MERNILILDDDKMIYAILNKIIGFFCLSETYDFKIFYAKNISEAKQIVLENKIDMIFSDYLLSNNETSENFLSWIKEQSIDAKIFVITAITDILLNRQLKNLGASGIINKPFNREQIISKIKYMVA